MSHLPLYGQQKEPGYCGRQTKWRLVWGWGGWRRLKSSSWDGGRLERKFADTDGENERLPELRANGERLMYIYIYIYIYAGCPQWEEKHFLRE